MLTLPSPGRDATIKRMLGEIWMRMYHMGQNALKMNIALDHSIVTGNDPVTTMLKVAQWRPKASRLMTMQVAGEGEDARYLLG